MFVFKTIFLILFTLINASFANANGVPLGFQSDEVRQFEQNYEQWIQTMVLSITRKSNAIVLVDFTYQTSEAAIRGYQNSINAEHLPGLPQVKDPHPSRPFENPVARLLEKRNFKIIFEEPINSAHTKMLETVLHSKLKLEEKRGDTLVIEMIDPKPTREEAKMALPLGAIALLFLAYRFRKTEKPKPVPFKAAELPVEALSVKALPVELKVVFQNERPSVLATAFHRCSKEEEEALFKFCSIQQKKEILKIWLAKKNENLATEKIQFYRTLLLAKMSRKHLNEVNHE